MLLDIFAYSAIFGGIALVIQVGMMFLGFDDIFDGMEGEMDLGFDTDTDTGHGSFWFLEMLSLRTISAAAAFFGLAGWICLSSGLSGPVAIGVALASGYAALYSVYWAFKQLFKLETDGNEDIRNAIDKPARVYVPIPATQQGAGKVQLKMQNRIVEYQALTEETAPLKTGDQVVITEVISGDTVLVRRETETATS